MFKFHAKYTHVLHCHEHCIHMNMYKKGIYMCICTLYKLTVLDTVKGRDDLLPQYTPPNIKLS